MDNREGKIRGLVTTIGRSHFMQVATSLARTGVSVDLLQGWIVRDPEHSWFLRIASLFVGRDLVFGFKRRLLPEMKGHEYGDFVAEFVQVFGRRLFGWNRRCNERFQKLGMIIHGWRAKRLMKKNRYDIFHVRTCFGRGGAVRYAKKHGIKVLADHSAGSPNFIIDTVYAEKGRCPWSLWWYAQKDAEEADLLLVDCDWVKETFTMYGYPQEKIRVVYMGLDQKFNGLRDWSSVDLSELGKSGSKPLKIVFSGPFMPHKGNEAFLAAVEKLCLADLVFDVQVIGSCGISEEQRKRYPQAMAKIRFYGHVNQDRMCEIMRNAHVYLFPSLSEGCAKSAFEAMSMGLCVVCTKETGLPLVDGVDGHLILKNNPDSIVTKIQSLVSCPERIRETGLAATRTLKSFTWEAYAENVKKVYEELLKRGE